ncbi:MAG: DUF4388 domain-containing protein [Myxococcota bacterium]
MIPSAKDLQDISRLKEGNLVDQPFPVLLYAFSVHERSLVLEITRNQLQKHIIFEDGIPVDCRSNLLHETLGKFLVERGKLGEEDYQRCLSESVAGGVQLGDVLLKYGLINAFDLFKMLQQNLAHKLLDGFTWKTGQFKVHTDVPAVESPLKVRVPQLVLAGVTGFAPQEQVDADIGALVGRNLGVHPAPPISVSSLKLSAKQTRVMTLLKKRPRIDELMVEANLPPDELTRFIYALALMGVVLPADQIPADAAPAKTTTKTIPVVEAPVVATEPAPAPAAAAPAPAAPPPPPVDVEKTRNEVTAAYLNYRKQDAFDLLGLKLDATPSAIRDKFLAFSQKYAPWTFQHPDLQPLAERAQDLFLAGARAYALLQDAEQRNSLIHRKMNPVQESRGNPDKYFAIKTNLLDATGQFKEGVARMNAGKFAEAIPFLEFASDCDPQKGLYRAELTWSRYRATPKLAAQCLKDLQEAMRMDPECGLAVYYAGEISRALSDHAGADALLRKACKMLPNDRRPTEALKQLILETQRK